MAKHVRAEEFPWFGLNNADLFIVETPAGSASPLCGVLRSYSIITKSAYSTFATKGCFDGMQGFAKLIVAQLPSKRPVDLSIVRQIRPDLAC